jgi:hypothetical protein
LTGLSGFEKIMISSNFYLLRWLKVVAADPWPTEAREEKRFA